MHLTRFMSRGLSHSRAMCSVDDEYSHFTGTVNKKHTERIAVAAPQLALIRALRLAVTEFTAVKALLVAAAAAATTSLARVGAIDFAMTGLPTIEAIHAAAATGRLRAVGLAVTTRKLGSVARHVQEKTHPVSPQLKQPRLPELP